VSQLLIQHYLNELQTLRRISGTALESVVSEAFKTLLKDWGKSLHIERQRRKGDSFTLGQISRGQQIE
jgi:hypothetical protein